MKYLLLFAAIGFIPFVSSAATYHYVNTQGMTASVEAPDAETALRIAPNIKANSGVALDQGLIEANAVVPAAVNAFGYAASGETTFHYVTEAGVTDSVEAPNADTALRIAPNIAVNSGVALDMGLLEDGMRVLSAESE